MGDRSYGPRPKYLSVKLGQQLMFKQDLQIVRSKAFARNSFLGCLANILWVAIQANATALALVCDVS